MILTQEAQEQPEVELNASDRCDACHAAAARVRWTRGPGTLLLCCHHSAVHTDALIDQGWRMA